MPDYKKNSSKLVDVNHSPSSASIKENLKSVQNSRFVKYVQRQAHNKQVDKAASERFHEYSGKGKPKTKVRDINAPKTIQEKSTDTFHKVARYLKVHKAPRDDRAVRHFNPKYLLIILAAACVALMILSGVNEKVRAPFKSIASVLVVPAQKGINSIGLWLSDKFEAQKTLAQLEDENKELQARIDELTLDLTSLRQKELELDRLRDLLTVKDKYASYDMEAANIIAKDTSKWFSTFTIDKGSLDGIQKDMNVIAKGGLVGIVIDVGESFATVRSIIDDESSVSAQFEDNSELCIVNGSLPLMEQNLMEFTDVGADVMITLNTPVITSQVSSKYFPGILIGYVSDYRLDANDLTQSGHLKPAVDFSDLREVLIITEVKRTSDQ